MLANYSKSWQRFFPGFLGWSTGFWPLLHPVVPYVYVKLHCTAIFRTFWITTITTVAITAITAATAVTIAAATTIAATAAAAATTAGGGGGAAAAVAAAGGGAAAAAVATITATISDIFHYDHLFFFLSCFS